MTAIDNQQDISVFVHKQVYCQGGAFIRFRSLIMCFQTAPIGRPGVQGRAAGARNEFR